MPHPSTRQKRTSMSHRSTTFRLAVPARGALVLAGGLLLAGTVLAGCAGGKPAAAQSSPSGSQQPGRAGFAGAGEPAAFGLLAEIDAHVLQVQNQATGQVSVSYSTSTEFSQTRQVSRTALQVGDCVTAIGQRSSSGSPSASPSAGSSSAGSSGQPSRPTSFAAASVQISSAINGSCVAAGLGGARGGTRPSGFPSSRPSGFPSGRPSNRPSGQRVDSASATSPPASSARSPRQA